MNAPWTEAQDDFIRTHWLNGLSATAIAGLLTDRPGITRNAVIGRLHRMGVPPRANPNKKSNQPRPRKPRPPRAKPITHTPPHTLSPIGAKRIMDIGPGECRYIREPLEGPWAFCSRACAEGRSFCADHHALVYVPGKPKNDAAKVASWAHYRDAGHKYFAGLG